MHPKGIDMHPILRSPPLPSYLASSLAPQAKPKPALISVCYFHMYAELNACMRKTVGCMYAEFGCMDAETVGCKVYGCWVQSIWILLGACLCLLGACLWIGWAHVCGCWVQLYGDVWVQSICLLDASLIRLIACLIVGSLPDSR